jgi:hypothetical protein
MRSFHLRRFGQYLCDITVTKNDAVPASARYRAHLDQVEREADGRHIPVPVAVPDTFGPTAREALQTLDAVIMAWLREHRGNP